MYFISIQYIRLDYHDFGTQYSLKKIVILHPYLPITATSTQWPLSSVFQMAIMERFDCIIRFLNLIIHFCSFFTEQYLWNARLLGNYWNEVKIVFGIVTAVVRSWFYVPWCRSHIIHDPVTLKFCFLIFSLTARL